MASNQKKTSQQRPKNNWFLACFGISSKTTSNNKPSKSGGRKRLFKLCMPKIKIIIVRKKKVSFDAKTVGLKATQSMIMLEATKVQQVKIKHASITQEPKVQRPKESNDYHELQSRRDESDAAKCDKQESTPRVNKWCHTNKVTKDSLTGLSIMVMTLIIMSIWGRLCAILCMSAWLYCVPILRAYKYDRPNLDNIKIDMTSKLYNKNVVLEGLLQRDHKIGIGVL